MSEQKVHYRSKPFFGPTSCGRDVIDLLWSTKIKDVTCASCLRSKVHYRPDPFHGPTSCGRNVVDLLWSTKVEEVICASCLSRLGRKPQ
jgi:hypothetical protein